MKLLSLQEVTKIFGGLIAVNDLSFSVDAGSIVGLIGPNGAGKTTVFNCITGNYTPERGRIFFDGEPITGLKPHRVVELGIARTFQSIRLFGKLPVLENVLAGRHCRMKAGLFACMLHTPGQRREEKAAVAWRNCASWAWPTAARKPPEACPTEINDCWKSRVLWLRTRAC